MPKDGSFYTTDANADFAIKFLTDSEKEHPKKPFFLYLAFNAPHGPIQAWPQDIAKYRGKYLIGWDKLREQRYQKQLALGIMKPEWKLSPRPATIPAWDSLTAKEKDFEDLRMSIYAAMVDRMDQAIGRVLAAVKKLGQEDNTLVIFLSDNGASPYDRGRVGTLPSPTAHWEYGLGWANACNTPFRHYKRNQYGGGVNSPFIANWPGHIQTAGEISEQPGHIIDLMATLMDVGQGTWPKVSADGRPLAPLPGLSLAPILAGETRPPPKALYFELMNHRAIIEGNWKLASDWGQPWALYDLAKDRTELHDLAKSEPARFKQLQADWGEMVVHQKSRAAEIRRPGAGLFAAVCEDWREEGQRRGG